MNPEVKVTEVLVPQRSAEVLVDFCGHGREWKGCMIRVTELISPIWTKKAAAYSTQDPDCLPKASLFRWYSSEHSPIRMGIYFIEARGIPNYVCGHLVRHHVGCIPFMQTSRPDRGGGDDTSRYDAKNLAISMNSQALIDVSQKRLCVQSDKVTLKVVETIKELVDALNPDLARCMMPSCEYRGKTCWEFKPCGKYKLGGEK